MSFISIQKISITKLNTDAIVNAANDRLLAGGGVCGAIFREAGYDKLTAACERIGGCPTGRAVITPGFALASPNIIHAVGPIWRDGKHGEPELLYGAYTCALKLAMENELHSIAFPLISSGIYGYPLDGAWQQAISACNDFINEHSEYDIEIVFAVLDDAIKEFGERVLGST